MSELPQDLKSTGIVQKNNAKRLTYSQILVPFDFEKDNLPVSVSFFGCIQMSEPWVTNDNCMHIACKIMQNTRL